MKIIYVDMDGVLCDFTGKYTSRFGMSPSETRRSGERNAINETWSTFVQEGLFTQLDMLPNADRLIDYVNSLKNVRISILSSSGGFEYYRQVHDQKIKWLDSHGINWAPVIVPGRRYKAGFANKTSAIIDDTPDVIESFNRNSGLGILYTPDQLDNTINTLNNWL